MVNAIVVVTLFCWLMLLFLSLFQCHCVFGLDVFECSLFLGGVGMILFFSCRFVPSLAKSPEPKNYPLQNRADSHENGPASGDLLPLEAQVVGTESGALRAKQKIVSRNLAKKHVCLIQPSFHDPGLGRFEFFILHYVLSGFVKTR